MTLSENAEDFWVAAAAAAPVIALAGLVSISDATGVAGMLRRARGNGGPLGDVAKSVKLAGWYNFLVITYSILNLVTQGFVLIVALLTLFNDRTSISGAYIIIVEALGIFIVLLVATLAGVVGAERRRLEEAQAQEAAGHLANAIASKFRQAQLANPEEAAGRRETE